MAGAEALDANRLNDMEGKKVNELRSDREMGETHSGNVLNLEAGRIRKDVLERMNKDDKSVISDKEKADWKDKVTQANQDISRLTSIKNDFEEQWRRSLELRKQFEGKAHGADKEGMLKKGEYEKLEQSFMQSSLEEKQKAMKELESELNTRRKELGRFLKLEKDVQKARKEVLEKAENYDEKLRVLESAEKENANYQEYRKVFNKHKDKLAKKTISDYLEWFLTLSDSEQKSAIRKAEKDDIKPRTELFDIHGKLPKEYQDSSFKEWGKTQRERYLGAIEQRIDRDHRTLLRKEAREVFSEKDYKFCEQSFGEIHGETGDRLAKKVMFLEALPGHIKMAKAQWKEFDKFDEAIQDMLYEDFKEGDFDDRKDILTKKAPKLTERYTKLLNRLNNKMDAHISEAVRGDFEKGKTIESKAVAVEEGEKFQKSKDLYFAKWKKNAKYFRSKPEVYEKWYAEDVTTLEDAKRVERELAPMIQARKTVHMGMKKLPKHLQERTKEDLPLAQREKELQKLQEVAKHYVTVIPFFIKNAEQARKEQDIDKALDFYLQALKLDPDNKELKTMAAQMRQKGANHSLSGSNKVDEEETQKVLKQVDSMHEINDEAAKLARNELLLHLAKKHREQVGATGTTTEARARASIKQLDSEDHDVAETIIDEHGKDFTVDQTGTIRKKIKIKTTGDQERDTEEQLEAFFGQRKHKSDVTQKEMAAVAFETKAGEEMELDTAEKTFQDQTSALAKKREERFLKLVEKDAGLNKDQLKAVQEAFQKSHDEDEVVQDEIERLKAA